MAGIGRLRIGLGMVLFLATLGAADAGEDWIQLKYDCRHSGNVPERSLTTPLGLVAAVPLTDAVFTAPVVAAGRVYVVDGSGVAWCLDAATLKVIWKFATSGGNANCNNVCSPAVAGGYLHFGTMAGSYYVLDAATGAVVKEIKCGEPVFSAPVVGHDQPSVGARVYFATLGSRIHALKPDGTVCWVWDFVRRQLDFAGDRWSGEDWLKLRGRADWQEQFCCNRDIALLGKTLLIPAGGTLCWLEDSGAEAQLRGTYLARREAPATLGLSIGDDGTVYRQWTRRDNEGNVEILRPRDGKVEANYVRGTETSYQGAGSLSFSAVSLRGRDVYRCRPEEGFGLCLHTPDGQTQPLGGEGSIASPVLLKDSAVYGGLDGSLHVVPLPATDGTSASSPKPRPRVAGVERSEPPATGISGGSLALDPGHPRSDRPNLELLSVPLETTGGTPVPRAVQREAWSFKTAFGKAVSAPVAVCDGRVYFGCEDGYLYVLGPAGKAPLPSKNLQLEKIRSPLSGKLTDSTNDWYTNFGNLSNTNTNPQGLRPPLKMKWIRRYEGTVKHLSVCGGGRMYTHTAEGQIFAVEQETGRLLWRRYFPGVHVSYTSPIYHDGRLLVPQAGLQRCRLRCLDAATGKLLWEAPFSGSPSWNRQLPPIPYKNLVIYQFSSGRYTPQTWLFEHQSTFGFPKDQKPLVRAYDADSGKEVWTRDFSEYGAGGDDAGMCLMDGTLYYSCYFGGKGRAPTEGWSGVTAAIQPETGRILWATTKYAVHAGCTVSGADGRLYLGGYNPVEDKVNRVWCLDAKDGSLVWKSEPVSRAIHVITVGQRFLFTHSQYENGYLIDKQNGKILSTLVKGYRCTRFTLSEPYLLGPNLTLFDLSDGNRLVSCGPAIDVLLCVGQFASNGRLFSTTNGSGFQASLAYGEEAASLTSPWEAK